MDAPITDPNADFKRDLTSVFIRVPRDLHEQIKRLAHKRQTSINKMGLAMLKRELINEALKNLNSQTDDK